MEPNQNNYGPPAELPPLPEQNNQPSTEFGAAPAPELSGTQPPAASSQSQQQTTPMVNPQGLYPNPQPVPTPVHPAATSSATAALMADDADLIEKEWVTKAKAIVMRTKDDPREQNKEMNKVKADYLKKRYNKDLKLSEN